jgi:hypothetical protein
VDRMGFGSRSSHVRLRIRRSATVVLLLAIAGCGEATETRSPDAPRTVAREVSGMREAGGGEDARRFVPATYREGDRLVLPLTFTDGTTAELVYPPELGLAELGLVPYGSGELQGNSSNGSRGDGVGRDFLILHGELDEVLAQLNGGGRPSLLGHYRGADGQSVGLWDLPEPEPNELGFQFGRWAVLVYDYPADSEAAMTEVERAAWSASFAGRETADGFLLLHSSGPLRLARAGESAGPQLSFGSVGEPPWLALYPGDCKPIRDHARIVHGRLVSWSPGFADWCLSELMRVHARGRNASLDAMIEALAIRKVSLAKR